MLHISHPFFESGQTKSMTLLLLKGIGPTADHRSSMSSFFVCALCFPHTSVPCLALQKLCQRWLPARNLSRALQSAPPPSTQLLLAQPEGKRERHSQLQLGSFLEQIKQVLSMGFKGCGLGVRERTVHLASAVKRSSSKQCCRFHHFWGPSPRRQEPVQPSQVTALHNKPRRGERFLCVIHLYASFPFLSLFHPHIFLPAIL